MRVPTYHITAKENRKLIFKPIETYVREYHGREREEIRLKRVTLAAGDCYVPGRPEVLFAARIRVINEIAPQDPPTPPLIANQQRHFRAILVKATNPTLQILCLMPHRIRYGYGKVDQQHFPLDKNAIIEATLVKCDFLSVEDLVDEIGRNFKQDGNFLRPFKLSEPNGGWRRCKFKHGTSSAVNRVTGRMTSTGSSDRSTILTSASN
ncbi:hypothetical protein M422DRAFT_266591 [Sphaerobolus stellatus SS14]|uniref:Large ribosomal subunit protein uL30 N-terminal eukaryotes domain-containing protein n=1 Tax=Sphaerobolus stellatus (strain SS14) TaxID=990650 RepID=A0A0C9UR86_SPHS4|nr:hypothetical protein M422DRAFT_266591 [Sphaerobolus stellatus SS14]